MPSIIEYENVLADMQAQSLQCQYYNSGAFGFDRGVATHFTGWIGPLDSTIRPEALGHARQVARPYEAVLADLATNAWMTFFPGPVWVMPKSNWGYELDFGSKAWLPAALRDAGIDPTPLERRTNSPAIEFLPNEQERFTPLVRSLLKNLHGSDFALAFRGNPIACTLHHHKQIWWISNEASVIEKLQNLSV